MKEAFGKECVPSLQDGEASAEEFFRRYAATRTPAVVRRNGLAEGLRERWTREYLTQTAGSEMVEVEKRRNLAEGFGEATVKETFPFSKVVELLRSPKDDQVGKDDDDVGDDDEKVPSEGELYYLTTQAVALDRDGAPLQLCSAPLTSLRGDLPVPHPLLPTLAPHQLNVWMGSSRGRKGVSSGLHHDSHDNLYLLLDGRKRFALFCPADAPCLYPTGRLSAVHPNGLINYAGGASRDDGAHPIPLLARRRRAVHARLHAAEQQVRGASPESLSQARAELRAAEQQLDQLLEALLEAGLSGDSDDDNDNREDADDYEDDNKKERKLPDEAPLPHFSLVGRLELADHSRFPLLNRVRPIYVTLEPGDMLYLPAGWFHDVTSYGHSCAVNYWLYPPSLNAPFSQPYPDDFWHEKTKHLFW